MAADQSDTSSPESSQNPTAESGGSEANGDKKQTAPQRLGFFKGLAEIFKSLISPDRPSRSMALLFVISLCGFSAVTFLLIQTLRQSQSLQKNAKTATDPHHSAEDHHSAHESSSSTPQYKKNLIELGSFQIELKPAPGAPPPRLKSPTSLRWMWSSFVKAQKQPHSSNTHCRRSAISLLTH